MRGRFAWLGAGVILFAVGCVATVGTQDTWLDGYGIIAYFLVLSLTSPVSRPIIHNPFEPHGTKLIMQRDLTNRNPARALIARRASKSFELGGLGAFYFCIV